MFNELNTQELFVFDVEEFLLSYECCEILHHSLAVAHVAERLCRQFKLKPESGFVCGLLHDIGGIYPNAQRVEVAKKLSIGLVKEEIEFPLIIHQKISAVLAKQKFAVEDIEILKAIECHTTLRSDYTQLDLVLFLADKIAWDQEGKPPYLDGLLKGLQTSMEKAALYYINYLMDGHLIVRHPWLVEAKKSLEFHINENQ